jgi:hypothetical protein
LLYKLFARFRDSKRRTKQRTSPGIIISPRPSNENRPCCCILNTSTIDLSFKTNILFTNLGNMILPGRESFGPWYRLKLNLLAIAVN